jgi:hypothetical protein
MNRQPERSETNAARQARLRERRKELGFRRISLWLSPEQVATLETLGGEPWLGTTIKAFLESAVSERAGKAGQRALFDAHGPAPVTAEPLPGNDKAALWREADSLNKAGLSWAEIARRWNAEGRRTDNGAQFRGWNLQRDVQHWKQGNGE